MKTRSLSVKSFTASIWRMLASRLPWVSSTPLGGPSEPLVKSTTAGLSRRCGPATDPGIKHDSRQRAPLPPARHPGPHVLQINELHARLQHRLQVQPGPLQKRREVMICLTPASWAQASIVGSAGGKIENGGHFVRRPQAQEGDGNGVGIGQQHAHARPGASGQQLPPPPGQGRRPRQQSPVAQFAARNILQRHRLRVGAAPWRQWPPPRWPGARPSPPQTVVAP